MRIDNGGYRSALRALKNTEGARGTEAAAIAFFLAAALADTPVQSLTTADGCVCVRVLRRMLRSGFFVISDAERLRNRVAQRSRKYSPRFLRPVFVYGAPLIRARG